MGQKAFAIGDHVLNDQEELTTANSTIVSALGHGVGLYRTRAVMQKRYGSWPLIGALERQSHSFTLRSSFRGSDRGTVRENLTTALNYEAETLKRLVVADQVAPEGLLVSFGPWETYRASDGTMYSEDVLQTAKGTLTNGVLFYDGNLTGQKGVVPAGAATNVITNPSLETNSLNWAPYGSASGNRVSTRSKFGYYCYELVTTGSGDGSEYTQLALSGSTAYTVSAWVRAPSGSTMRMQFWDGVDTTNEDFTGTGAWQRVILAHTTNASPTATILRVFANAAIRITFQVDCIQIEQSAYVTPYCDGSLGPGHTWSGTEHASTSSRTAGEFNLDDYADDHFTDWSTRSFRIVAQMPYDANGDWPVASQHNVLFDVYKDANNRIRVSYFPSTDWFCLTYVEGGSTIQVWSSTQTFSAGDWVELLVTLNVDGNAELYVDGADKQTGNISARNAIAPDEWNVGSDSSAANHGNFVVAEYQVWDRILSSDEGASLYSNGTASGRARSVNVLCESSEPVRINQAAVPDAGMVSFLMISGDVRWRCREADMQFWRVYDDTGYHRLTVPGEDDVYPVLRIIPKTAKTTGFSYRRWVPIKWRVSTAYTRYPVILGTWATGPGGGTPIGDGKMQADGDDLRVYVNGSEVDRWLDDINMATTKILINLNFSADVSMTLKTAIAGSGDVEEIEVNEDISQLPAAGILYIDSEAFVYTGRDTVDKKVIGVTRAAKGTSMAAHSASTTVFWIQHDVWIYYGDSSLSAPTTDDDYQACFDLGNSTNSYWYFTDFGEDDGLRAANWQTEEWIGGELSGVSFYHGNQGSEADPWGEMGIHTQEAISYGIGYLYNPCGITTFDVPTSLGEKRIEFGAADGGFKIVSKTETGSWRTEYNIPDPTGTSWTNWDRTETLMSNSVYAGILNECTAISPPLYDGHLEISRVNITLVSSYTPVATINSEQTVYPLSVALSNETTGDVIALTMFMDLDETLEVDTNDRTVTLLDDGSVQLSALTITGGVRRDWLKLQPGENVLKWTDTGTEEVEIDFWFDRRYKE
jgi:hypothetical protein